MNVVQISVFVENKKGRLAEIAAALAEREIDISAVSISDTTDFGILRLIVNKPKEAEMFLKEKGYAVKATEVIAVGVADRPGGLASALKVLDEEHISVEYMYAFMVNTQQKEALMILRVEEPKRAAGALGSCSGVRVLSSEEVCSL